MRECFYFVLEISIENRSDTLRKYYLAAFIVSFAFFDYYYLRIVLENNTSGLP